MKQASIRHPVVGFSVGILLFVCQWASARGIIDDVRDARSVGLESAVSGSQLDRAKTIAPCGFGESVCDEADGCCGAGCCDTTGCGCGFGSGLLKWLEPSDRCFRDFISPMTNPVFFEDPRTLTEARLIFIHHKFPLAAGSNDIQLYAMQMRAALTDRLSIVAAKDGFIVSDNPLIDDGWADVSLGLKYNLFADACTQRILSSGFAYELPVGSTRALQGNGDGEFHLYLTGGTALGSNGHWISGTGFRLPSNRNRRKPSVVLVESLRRKNDRLCLRPMRIQLVPLDACG